MLARPFTRFLILLTRKVFFCMAKKIGVKSLEPFEFNRSEIDLMWLFLERETNRKKIFKFAAPPFRPFGSPRQEAVCLLTVNRTLLFEKPSDSFFANFLFQITMAYARFEVPQAKRMFS